MSPESDRIGRYAALLAAALGLVAGSAMSTVSWGDVQAPVAWSVFALLLAVGALRHRGPITMMSLYLVASGIAVLASVATGSTWAGASWWPVLLAVVAIGRVSASFVLALTVTVLVRDAATLVLLDQVFDAAATSGSVQYFLGLIGVVAVPLWFREAIRSRTGSVALLTTIAASVVVALGVWAVLASSSRAALLGLIAVAVAGVAAPMLARERRTVPWRPILTVLAAVAILVPVIDTGLGYVFGTGAATAGPTVAGQIAVSVDEVVAEDRLPGGVRLPLWRQAWLAMLARPLGHGPGSYGHVNHAYQNEPLLWSGSPHSVWALAAVETGVPGLLALLALVVGGLYVAARRGSAAMPALLGATAVMSLDVFGSMPVQSLVWWAVIGTAWGPAGSTKGRWRAASVAMMVAFLAVGTYFSLRLASPCGDGCDPIVHYGGHPRLAGTPSAVIGDDPDDPRWDDWRARYPLAFWLAYAETAARAAGDPTATLDLLRAYPYQSAERYVEVADALAGQAIAEDVASCGLVRFFDGRPILRDWRSSAAELEAQRLALEERSGTTPPGEEACVRAGIPAVAVGMQ